MEPANNFLSLIKMSAQKLPVFKEEKDTDWIVYGTDKDWKNRYPDFLLQCFNRSTTHGALVDSKAHYIAGNGFEIDNTGLNTLGAAKLLDAIKKANDYDESISDIAKKVSLDFILFGGSYVEISYAKNGKDFSYYHMDYTKLRLSKDEDGFWYSNDWSKAKDKQTKDETGLEFIPLWTKDTKKGRAIMWLKRYSPGMRWYPLPEYVGAIPYVECEYEISNYHLNNIRSNFHIGTIINFNNGKPDEATKEYIEERLEEKFAGTDNAGSFLVSYNINKENAATVTRLAPSELDKQFEQLKKDVEASIMIAHKVVSPMLFGIKTEGQLGGSQEIQNAYEVFKNTYVVPVQNIINKFFNKILELKGFNGRVRLKEVPPIMEKLSSDVIAGILTKNELRKLAGYEEQTSNNVTDALTTMSPLVANKVLENLTVNELRKLIGLPSVQNGDIVSSTIIPEEPAKPVISSVIHRFDDQHLRCKHEFTDDEITLVMGEFKACAKKKDDYEFVFSKEIQDFSEAEDFETEFFAEAEDGENVALPEGEQNPKKPTKTTPKADLVVMYSYEPRPGLKSIIPTTRDFCRELLQIDGLYSRADIGRISNTVGWDVWKHRGGYWGIKGTDRARDYCRHVWQQHVVRKK